MSPFAFHHVPPGIQPAYLSSEESVYFDPSLLNTELWAPKTPRIVKIRCEGNKTLIAVWEAIHWLMVKYSAIKRRDFGLREIAEEARVSLSRLSGKNGYIQQLIDLNLLEIVGHQHVAGSISPRNIYRINMAFLEQCSYAEVLEMLKEREIAPPPKPRPVNQATMFEALDLEAPTGHSDLCPWEPAPCPVEHTHPPDQSSLYPDEYSAPTGAQPDQSSLYPDEYSAPAGAQPDQSSLYPDEYSAPAGAQPDQSSLYPDEYSAPAGAQPDMSGCSQPATPPYSSGNGCTHPATAAYPDEYVKRKTETNTERENAPPPEMLDSETLRSAINEAVHALRTEMQHLFNQQTSSVPQQPEIAPPPAPDGEYLLPTHPLDIWAADGDLSRKERLMVEELINRFDPITGGYGAYWVGRAMFVAEGYTAAKGKGPATLAYVKGVLRRWHEYGTWGQDYMTIPPAPSTDSAQQDSEAPVPDEFPEPVPAPAPTPAPSSSVAVAHVTSTDESSAVRLYEDAILRVAGAEQRKLIVDNVTDLVVWRSVVNDWRDAGWDMRSVTGVKKMLDRYSKSTGERTTVEEDSLSDMIIEEYRDLISFDEYQEWLGKASSTRHEPLQHQRILRRFLHMVKQREQEHSSV